MTLKTPTIILDPTSDSFFPFLLSHVTVIIFKSLAGLLNLMRTPYM